MEQIAQVASYFDQISGQYRSRYAERNPFHNHFFRQRLRTAIGGFSFAGKTVLDIGAGTGALYDELLSHFPDVDYFGCDISAQMLAQSVIPSDRAMVGKAQEIAFSRDQFDFIFSLGVTTYQEPSELSETWRFIADRLSPKGVAVVSFTNRGSIDYLSRKAMKIAKPLIKRGVFGQSFGTYAYRTREVECMAQSVGLRVARVAYLNQAFSPFNTLMPKSSVSFAKFLERQSPAMILPLLSSDFIVFASRA